MIIRPVGDYKDRLNKLPFKSIINAAVTRMSESLAMLQELDYNLSTNDEYNTQKFIIPYELKPLILKTIITKNELFVMLYHE